MKTEEVVNLLKSTTFNYEKKKRVTPAQRRKQIAKDQIAAIRRVISAIRRAMRETPAWTRAYCSAITKAEIEIQQIAKEAGL